MDWNRTSDQDPKVAIAIIKLPAKVDVIDPRYGGAVIYNPGGPGASGVQAVLDEGYEFQTIVDSLDRPDSPLETGEAKYFDIIGFDPRGVNHTVPAVACFPSSLQRLIWKLEHEAEGRLNDPRTSLDQKWARYKSRSASCLAEADEIGKDSVAYHLNAAPVARDIIEIAERHGQWRESHAADLVADKSKADTSDHQAPFGQHALRDSLQAVRWQQGKEKVQFWGTSYGTALGATLAAMYPERVHRALFDSVLDPADWIFGIWMKNLRDTDKMFDAFCRYCYLAGKEKCKLWKDSPHAIATAFDQALSKLAESPIAVPGNDIMGPQIVTYTDLKRMFVTKAIYSPWKGFPLTAEFVHDILEGNGTSFATYKNSRFDADFRATAEHVYSANTACLREGPYSQACQVPNEPRDERSPAIWCLEASDHHLKKASFRDWWADLTEQSKLVGSVWAERRLECVGWSIRPVWPFQGPWSSITNHPILLVNNLIDPATPLQNAYALSNAFPGSAVVEQHAVGHGITSSPSKCTRQIIRQYFQTGELPKNGTICKVDDHPFGLSLEDPPLRKTHERLSSGHFQ